MTVENIKVFGIMDALRGMRNPLNSWSKNDSYSKCDETDGHIIDINIGPNDLKLSRTLTNGGQPHRKFLRQINVTMDITAPVYWWAEMDTYKIGTTRNSCSVQHKGSSRDFTVDDFTIDNIMCSEVNPDIACEDFDASLFDMNEIIEKLNYWRQKYVETKDYRYFRIMRQLMPMGYNYKATWSGTYETLLNIYEWRHNHRLIEWQIFCKNILDNCPAFKDICVDIKDENNIQNT